MEPFKTVDLLVTVMPVNEAQNFPGLSVAGCECTIGCTNTDTTTYKAKISGNDLATLRRILSALQASAPPKSK